MTNVSPFPAADSEQTSGPLTGLRVLDFTHVLAGPACTRFLADFGADVVRVESSTHLDTVRLMGPYPPERVGDREAGGLYVSTNAGKRGITLNLRTEEGRAVARQLALACDVLVENFRPGVLGRLGLGYADLAAANPRLIYVSMSGFSSVGPRASWKSFNATLQAISGLQALTGTTEQPTGLANSWSDYVGGLHSLFVLLAALEQRSHTGSGCWLDVSLFEGNVASLGAAFYEREMQQQGNAPPRPAPYGSYPCRGTDRWCAISVVTEEHWAALRVALDADALALDERFATAAARAAHADALDAHVADWTRQRDVEEAVASLRAAGVPAAPVARIDDLAPRGEPTSGPAFRSQMHPRLGQVGIAGNPLQLSATPLSPAERAPRLGEHTAAVLGDWLQWDDETIASLRAQGALE